MLITDLLKPDQINLDLVSERRLDAINEVALLVQKNPYVNRFQGFYDALLAREKIESTCLGNDVAFPHARTDHLKGMVLAIGRSQNGVSFENTSQSVRLIFVIGTPKRMVTDYLSIVGALARVLKGEVFRHQLLSATSAEEFIALISEAEKLS